MNAVKKSETAHITAKELLDKFNSFLISGKKNAQPNVCPGNVAKIKIQQAINCCKPAILE